MMNQFTSIYGQLFCCSCPGGLSGSLRCENRTSVYVSYPLLAENSYAWLAGVLCFLLVLVVVVAGIVYCCRRRRTNSSENEMVSVIRFRDAIFPGRAKSKTNNHNVRSAFDNPVYREDMPPMTAETKVEIIRELSDSDDSLDSAFISSRRDSGLFETEDAECPDTKPMIIEDDESA